MKIFSDKTLFLISVFTFWLILSIHRDSVFPFTLDSSGIILSLYSAVLFIFLFFFFILGTRKKIRLDFKLNDFYLYFTLNLSLLILLFSNYRFFSTNQEIIQKDIFTISSFLIIFLFALTNLLVYFKRKLSNKTAYLSLLAISLLISLVMIWFIPNTPSVSDLMPIIQEQSKAFLNGESIYQYYYLDNGVFTQAVRQPGMHLLYLPAVLLNFDIRILNIFYFFGVGVLIWKIYSDAKNKISFDVFLLTSSLFLFMPYRIYRTDMYDIPYWFILVLSLYLFKKNKLTLSSILWGISISIQVWSWLFTPLFFIYLYNNLKFKSVIKYVSISLLTALMIMIPFIYNEFDNYIEHTFGFYSQITNEGIKAGSSIYLSTLVQFILEARYFKFLQIFLSAFVIFKFYKCENNFTNLIKYFGIIFFVFVSLNAITWPYMYFLIFLIIILYHLFDGEGRY